MKDCILAVLVSFVFLDLVKGLDDTKADGFVRKDGYCMWYGQCGINPLTEKPINCLYNGPAKPVDGPASQQILKELCPEMFLSKSNVCCDHNQLTSLQSGLQSGEQMLSRCPACWKNFRELYCRLICSPNNSMFLDPKALSADKKAIVAIDYYVDKSFRDGLYNSCKDVIFPSSRQKVMNFLCGTTVDKCTPLKFLDFMGNPEMNGESPFLINYPVTAKPPIQAMNANIIKCNQSFPDPITKLTRPACSCRDCKASCINPPPIEYLAAKIIFSIRPRSVLNQRTCYKNFLSEDCELTGTILRLNILKKVLRAQTQLMNMSAKLDTSSGNVNFGDICLKYPSNQNCVVLSVLQYWQNDALKLNKCITALTGKQCSSPQDYFTASWGDHLRACVIDPNLTDDRTKLHLPCFGSYGHAVDPSEVLGGYDRNNFTDASLLFVTFAIKKNLNEVEIEKAKAWQEKFVEYVKNYDDFELQVAYVPIDLPDPITKF